jgi:hydroxyacylglutathione hydrolase
MLLRRIYDADLSQYAYILRNQPEPPFLFRPNEEREPGGPAVLGRMPEPHPLTIDEVIGQLDDPTLVVLDTRANRAAFMKAHLRGSLYAPAKGSFSDFAGSYLGPDERIVLVVDSADQVEETGAPADPNRL